MSRNIVTTSTTPVHVIRIYKPMQSAVFHRGHQKTHVNETSKIILAVPNRQIILGEFTKILSLSSCLIKFADHR